MLTQTHVLASKLQNVNGMFTFLWCFLIEGTFFYALKYLIIKCKMNIAFLC